MLYSNSRLPLVSLACLLLFAVFTRTAAAEAMSAGIDVLEADAFRPLQGKRIGLITNQTGRDREGRSTLQVLAHAPSVQLKAVFAPEHGIAGLVEDAIVSSDTFKFSDGREIPIYSLYGSTWAPTNQSLSGLDALVFDIQDIGARFYTYAATMGMAMEAAEARNLDFFVLDRPNPIRGDIVEGPVLDSASPGIRSITSYFPIPVRHGLTMGEIARAHNILDKVGVRLQIIPLKNWSRNQWYDETKYPWTRPSPNMPDLDAATLYPGIGCFEAANLSVGRGTPIPFRWVGAPWLEPRKALKILKRAKLAGVRFKSARYVPSKSLYAGQKCRGIKIILKDRNAARPFDIFITFICALRDTQPGSLEIRWDAIRKMVGTDRFKELFESHAEAATILREFHQSADNFKDTRGPFLLY